MNTNQFTLTPKQTRERLEISLKSNIPCMVTSSPGLGKSSIIKDLAAQFNLELVDIRLSQLAPMDLLGLPIRNEDKMHYVPMDLLPLENDPLPKDKDGWLILFDELNSADKWTQAAAYRILLDREVGNYKLHNNVRMLCAGNQMSDNAIVHKLSSALQTRMTHVNMVLDTPEFLEFVADGVQKGTWHPLVLGFLEFRSGYAHTFDPTVEVLTYACPRSWEFLSQELSHGLLDVTSATRMATITGIIGEKAGVDFEMFLQTYQSLPKMSAIEQDPLHCPLPDQKGAKYALGAYFKEHITAANENAIVTYTERLPEEDLRIVIYRSLFAVHPTISGNTVVMDTLLNIKQKLIS